MVKLYPVLSVDIEIRNNPFDIDVYKLRWYTYVIMPYLTNKIKTNIQNSLKTSNVCIEDYKNKTISRIFNTK